MARQSWISYDWPLSKEGLGVLYSLTDQATGFPRASGILDRPGHLIAEHIPFKISLLSKGVDKTSFLGFLTGRQRTIETPGAEVPGIRVTNIFWAAQTYDGRVRSFKLSFWDSGESATKRYAHVEPSVRHGSHLMLLLYSGEISLREIEIQIEKITSPANYKVGILVVIFGGGPKLHDLEDLESKWGVSVHKIIRQSAEEARYLLTSICDSLWSGYITSSP